MKFEKFLKMTAGRGVIVDREDGEKWLLFDGVLMRIPDGVNIIAALRMEESEFITRIFQEYARDNCAGSELTGAELNPPDASASKVIRIFTDNDGGEIGISNKYFGLIERGDTVINVYDDEYSDDEPAALMVTEFDPSEGAQIVGVIFNDDYLAAKINERK